MSKGLKPDSYEGIFREYCQTVLDLSAPQLPYWFRAGLAQLYSTVKPGDGTIRLGFPPNRSYPSGTGGINMMMLIGIDRKAYLESRARSRPISTGIRITAQLSAKRPRPRQISTPHKAIPRIIRLTPGC